MKKTRGVGGCGKPRSVRFNDDALEAIAESALERNIGAPGLRMIIEELRLDLMYSCRIRRSGASASSPEQSSKPRSH